jgi:plastocyanin
MIRIFRRGLSPLMLGTVLSLLIQGNALAATVNVEVANDRFTPSLVKLKQGDTVQWTNVTPSTPHTATSNGIGDMSNGVGLWDTGTIPSGGGMKSFTFTTASKYPYYCQFHDDMTGTVQVAMKASPPSGGTGTTFKIQWATGGVPAGFDVQVQISRPGGPGFVLWLNNQTANFANFMPDAGTGVYKFRARLQNNTTGKFATFSAAKSITVA